MNRFALLPFALLLFACNPHPVAQPARRAPAVATAHAAVAPSQAAAEAAYQAKQYGTCATHFMGLAKDSARHRPASDYYNAACCYSLDGKADLAFAALDKAIAAGLHDVALFEKDTDLQALRSDPRWPKVLDAVRQQLAAWEASLGQPQLRRELLAMVEADQAGRKQLMALERGSPEAMALSKELIDLDKQHTQALKVAVAKYGWPGKSMVGEDGAQAAWLLVQHADLDVAFQKQALALMEPMVASGEVTAANYAYLYDRVAVAEKRPQRYGTQFGDQGEPEPIEDEAHVDERRKQVGLGTMAEYREQMRKMYGPQK
jgi:hypothetical protein